MSGNPAPGVLGMAPSAGKPALLFTVLLGAVVIANSACMIAFNRYLMQKGHFPFASVLVTVQMAFSFLVSLGLYGLKPSLFPSLSDPDSKVVVDRWFIVKKLLPVGACFCVPLLLSNLAYRFASVAFLQMMKQSSAVFVHLLSLAVGLEAFKLRNLAVLVWILLATIISVDGELNFSLVGVLLQGTSTAFESMKIVLQGMLLSNSGVKLDSFSYVLLTAPVILFCLTKVIGFLMIFTIPGFPLPGMSDMLTWWPYLLANSALAYCLNVVTAAFIKQTSPTGLCLTSMLKDTSIVLMGVAILHEAISTTQVFSFSAQVSLIGLWSLMKAFPAHFEDGIFLGLQRVLLQPTSSLLPVHDKAAKYGSAAPTEDGPAAQLVKGTEPKGA